MAGATKLALGSSIHFNATNVRMTPKPTYGRNLFIPRLTKLICGVIAGVKARTVATLDLLPNFVIGDLCYLC